MSEAIKQLRKTQTGRLVRESRNVNVVDINTAIYISLNMAFVHEDSCECVKTELDLFSIPPTQTSVENGIWIKYHPLTTVADGSLIEFDIAGNGEDYIDLAHAMLYVQAKITKQDDGILDDDALVGPVNLFLHSLFSQVDISLNETQVTASTNRYPYRAMLETLLRYGDDAKSRS